MRADRFRLARRSPRRASLLFGAVVFTLSCGGGEDSGKQVAPTTPRPTPRQLTGLEIAAERTAIRVGQVTGPLIAYGRYDDGTTGTVEAAWASSDPAIIGVGEDTTVIGIGVGEAEVSASFEDFTSALAFQVNEPNPRASRDRPDDFDGPQIHAVYAIPSDVEDGNLDRYGVIATSFEAIQNWLSDEIGHRLRLDTNGGELDVTFLRLPFTHEEGDGRGRSLIVDLEQAVAESIGVAPDKVYAVYYAGRASGFCGSAGLGGPVGALYLGDENCSSTSPGRDPEVASTYEAVMVHELLHVFGAVASCAPHSTEGSHVSDDATDLMYSGAERSPLHEAVTDVGRDDYFGHGREDCLDAVSSRYWERVDARRVAARGAPRPRLDIPLGDWPLRCGLE